MSNAADESRSEPRQGPETPAVSPEPQQPNQEPPAACYEALCVASHWDVRGEVLLSLVRRVLDGLIGDATRVVVVLEDADGAVRTFGDHQDPWGLFDALVCSPDEEGDEPPLGPGTRGRVLS